MRSRLSPVALLVALVLLVVPLAGCGTPAGSAGPATNAATSDPASPVAGVPVLHGSLTIFAAASLTESFNQLAAALRAASPDLQLSFNYGGSPTLRTQLAQGAKADVFASADDANMQGAQQDGTIDGAPQTFARNRLVVVIPAANPGHITALQDLAKPGLKLVLAQEQVPVGNYARQALGKLSQDPSYGSDFKSRVLANLVSNETDVKAALAKVELGEADASIVYVTDITPDAKAKVTTLAIPDQFNVIASYPVAVVKGAPDAANARAFIAYLLSPPGQAALADHGFAAP